MMRHSSVGATAVDLSASSSIAPRSRPRPRPETDPELSGGFPSERDGSVATRRSVGRIVGARHRVRAASMRLESGRRSSRASRRRCSLSTCPCPCRCRCIRAPIISSGTGTGTGTGTETETETKNRRCEPAVGRSGLAVWSIAAGDRRGADHDPRRGCHGHRAGRCAARGGPAGRARGCPRHACEPPPRGSRGATA